MVCYVPIDKNDGVLRARLEELAAERRRFGFRRLAVLLRRDGMLVNIKRVLRVHRQAPSGTEACQTASCSWARSNLRTKKFFYNAYSRLEWNKPPNTITKSFIYLGSGKFTHRERPRGFTIREAARLQSFADDFAFEDGPTMVAARIIGGAVPP